MSNEMMLKKLDEASKSGSELTRNIQASFSGALRVAQVAKLVKDALTVDIVNEIIMPLKNCDFGWRTDETRDKVYMTEQVRDMWVSAVLVGAAPVNNEVNMISGRCYLAKNYFKRMIRDYPKLTDFVAIPGKLTMTQSGALVEYEATWNLDGKPMSMKRTGNSAIPVRLNSGMGADGALGKAERKFLNAVFSMLTGSTFGDGDVEDIEPLQQTTARAEVVQQSLPEPEKQTQTKAVVEKLKKTVKPPEPEVRNDVAQDSGDEKAPWDGDDAPVSGEAGVSVATTMGLTAEKPADKPAPTVETVVKEKAAGFVKDPTTGEMRPTKKGEFKKPAAEKTVEKPVPTPAPEKPAATPPQNELNGQGEIETETIGQISAVKAKDKQGNPPYTIVSENATQYVTEDKEVAKQAKGYKEGGVPVVCDYTRDVSGRYLIVELRPADFDKGEGGENGVDQSDFEQQ